MDPSNQRMFIDPTRIKPIDITSITHKTAISGGLSGCQPLDLLAILAQ
ncbi:hypothetical protein [Microbacterium sp. WCS2018Hpa-23]|nr:hypothetical protein [Microbacterium sp. WCS2018Hpa-23]